MHQAQAPKENNSLGLAISGGAIGAKVAGIPGALVGAGIGVIIGQSTKKEILSKTKVLISFDYDYDSDLKKLLLGQSQKSDTPFEIEDWSVKEHIPGDWKAKVRSRLKRVDQVIVICGEYTHRAIGVAEEVKIAQEESIPYFLIKGRSSKNCTKPTTAKASDIIHKWTWEKLKFLIGDGSNK